VRVKYPYVICFSALLASGAGLESVPVSISDVPLATTFYMPIGSRTADLAVDFQDKPVFSFHALSFPDNFHPFKNEGTCTELKASSVTWWYVYTAFNVNATADGSPYVDSSGPQAGVPDGIPDFHPGEDWNAYGGQSDDACQPVYSIAAGVVIGKGFFASFGNTVFVLHKLTTGELIISVYAHLKELPDIAPGTVVDGSVVIGRVGRSGKGAGGHYHLHWEVRKASFLQNNGTTVSLKSDVNFKPDRWPATNSVDNGTSFINENYYKPSEFVTGHAGSPAGITTFSFTGIVSRVVDASGILRNTIHVGNSVSGTFTYDKTPPTADVEGVGFAKYFYIAGPSKVTASLQTDSGPKTVQTDYSSGPVTVIVRDYFQDQFNESGLGSPATWSLPPIQPLFLGINLLAELPSLAPPNLVKNSSLPRNLDLSETWDKTLPFYTGGSAITGGHTYDSSYYEIRFNLTSLTKLTTDLPTEPLSQTITFDRQTSVSTYGNQTTLLETQGFSFARLSLEGFVGLVLSDCSTATVCDGTKTLSRPFNQAQGSDAGITIWRSDGQPFTLVSVDAAEALSVPDPQAVYGNSSRIDVRGFLASGGTVSTSFIIDGEADGPGGINDFQSFILPAGWTNLSSISFYGFSATSCPGVACQSFRLDNIRVQ
jgi:peptidase M23-like protein